MQDSRILGLLLACMLAGLVMVIVDQVGGGGGWGTWRGVLAMACSGALLFFSFTDATWMSGSAWPVCRAGTIMGALLVQCTREVHQMTRVAILPVPDEMGAIAYRAVAGDKQSRGNTAGEALDALTAQLPEDEAGTLAIVQNLRPDRFFTAAQQQRLAELMARWRQARDGGGALSADEQAELDALVEAEVRAAASRAAVLADEAGR